MFQETVVMTHSSIRIAGSRTIYFDPYEVAESYRDADVVFVTHDHFDHFSPGDISKVAKSDTVLVMPENMKGSESKVDLSECRFVNPGDTLEIKGMKIEVVPAYNKMKPFHPKGRKNAGYIVTMDDVRFYVAGDTDMTEEIQKIKCEVALIPVGGTYTMNYKQAAKLVNQIQPKLAIPTHYGTVAGSPEDGKKFAELVDEAIEVRVMM